MSAPDAPRKIRARGRQRQTAAPSSAPSAAAGPQFEQAPVAPGVSSVAMNLRRLREDAGLSLSALAKRATVAKGSLSQLEQGRGNPTIDTLFALAYALGVTLADLVEEPATPQASVVRAAERPAILGKPLDARLLHRSTKLGGALEVYELYLHPGAEQHAHAHRTGVVEHVYVLDGQVRIGPRSAPVVLESGDYAYHPADVEHLYASDLGGRVLLLMLLPPKTSNERSTGSETPAERRRPTGPV